MHSPKHFLVTGGAGFVGSHLCESLIEKGYYVTVIDSLVTGRESNLRGVQNSERFQFIQADICDPIPRSSLKFLSKLGLTGIYHFACPASPIDFERLGYEILRVDSVGTFQMAELALEYNARLLLASTSEIYGDPEVHPQRETYFGNVNTIGPRACYDEVKRFSEAIISTYQRGCTGANGKLRKPKLNAGIVRIFNTYGPRMRLDDGRLVPQLAKAVLKEESVPVHGDGMQTRSLCYVDDLVNGIISLFDSGYSLPVNIGNPDERKILDLVEVSSKILGKPIKVVHEPERQDDPKQRCPDITLAKEILKWEPQVSLEEGLRKTFSAFQKEFDTGATLSHRTSIL